MSLVQRVTILAHGIIRQLVEQQKFYRSIIAHVAILCKIGLMRNKYISIHIETVTTAVSIRSVRPVTNGRSIA